MTPQQLSISVIDPISPAIEKVKLILFKPFDLGKWFVIGFCAWLAYLSGGGFNCNLNFPFRGLRHRGTLPAQLENFFESNIPLVLLLGSIVFIVAIAVAIVLLWLSSRGRFMFLDCVAKNKAQVKTPWRSFRRQGNSLFLFRLAAGIIFFLCVLLFIGTIVLFVALFGRGRPHMGAGALVAVISLLLVLLPIGIAFAIVLKFTRDFVVPIMYLHACSCVEAWRQFWTLLSGNKGKFALYILFQLVIGIVIGMIGATLAVIFSVILALSTCGVACCFMVIPGLSLVFAYVITVLLLPLSVFVRSYSLCYFRQFGPGFDVFSPEVTPPELLESS